jgi:alpha-glucosidase
MDQSNPLSYLSSIHHDGSARCVNQPVGRELRLGDQVTLRLRAAPDAPIARVLLRTEPDGEQRFTEMETEAGPHPPGEACRWWSVRITLHMPATSYRFLIFTQEDGVFWLNGSGLHRGLVTDAHDFRLLAGYEAPAWVRDSVFYQIFPDRFADGEPANNVRSGEYVYSGQATISSAWHEPPILSGRAAMVQFYGGDLQGIRQRLDYLYDLGINAIYLNPIFTAYSNHRYDVTDYENVDPHLGGNQALADLRQAGAERGLRFILDIVPNHCGVLHPWFTAAQQDPAAPSAEFFTFFRHPDEYASWLGVRSLPKLNYRSQALRQVMYAGRESVFRRWLSPPYGMDGWRLDVANMLGRQGADQIGVEVGRGIRQAIKAENPQAYILGENFFDASDQLQGDMWDAAMNYSGFSKPVRYWLSHFYVNRDTDPKEIVLDQPWPAAAMVESWQAFRASIPWVIARQQFNLLGSHDTERILTLVQGDPALNRLAAALLMTYVGVPSIYYGDEIGLHGAGSMRAPMPWDPAAWDGDLRDFYSRLIHLRRTSPALIEGGFQVLEVADDGLVYLRDHDQEFIIVAAQRAASRQDALSVGVWKGGIADGLEFAELFSGARSRVGGGQLPIPATGAGVQIWRALR